jgi:hypothetical protein
VTAAREAAAMERLGKCIRALGIHHQPPPRALKPDGRPDPCLLRFLKDHGLDPTYVLEGDIDFLIRSASRWRKVG